MRKKHIIIACDSYKGCLSSKEVNEALGWKHKERAMEDSLAENAEVVTLEMSDGGEGMLDAFLSVMEGERVTIHAHDALMRWINADYGIVKASSASIINDLKMEADAPIAIIEIAQTAGLALIEPEQRNPMKATSWGVGEMLMHAYRRGIRHFIIGLGGSATSDCGIGMLKAMGDDWKKIRQDSTFVLASDVTNPLCGPRGAAYVFAPQKGADAAMVEMLDARAKKFAVATQNFFRAHADIFSWRRNKEKVERSEMPGAGAAGGLGYAFLQFFDAEFHSGADLLLDAISFDQKLMEADLVVTGEGHSDRQTLMGKLPMKILEHTKKIKEKQGGVGPQVWLISGGVSDREVLLSAGFDRVMAVTPDDMPLAEAMKPEVAKKLLSKMALEIEKF